MVYTTPSTSELWSCLSFLGVLAMQIGDSEVQIAIYGDKELISRERQGCREVSDLFCKTKKPSSRLAKAFLNQVSQRFWLDPLLVWKPSCVWGLLSHRNVGAVSWETNYVEVLLVEREKNRLERLGKHRSCAFPWA